MGLFDFLKKRPKQESMQRAEDNTKTAHSSPNPAGMDPLDYVEMLLACGTREDLTKAIALGASLVKVDNAFAKGLVEIYNEIDPVKCSSGRTLIPLVLKYGGRPIP